MVAFCSPACEEDRGPRTEVMAGHFLLRGSYPRFITGSRPGADMPRGVTGSLVHTACCTQTEATVTAGWTVSLGLVRSVALLVRWPVSCGATAQARWGFRFDCATVRARRAGGMASSLRNTWMRSSV